MPSWTTTRLVVHANGQIVTPIESFTPLYTTPVTPIHSIEADNVGAISKPQTATFTMQVKALAPSKPNPPSDPAGDPPATTAADLAQLAIDGTKFDILLQHAKGNEWAFEQLQFRNCIITSANPSNSMMDGVPIAIFSGIILGFNKKDDIKKAP
jgi:hypothetical protein